MKGTRREEERKREKKVEMKHAGLKTGGVVVGWCCCRNRHSSTFELGGPSRSAFTFLYSLSFYYMLLVDGWSPSVVTC